MDKLDKLNQLIDNNQQLLRDIGFDFDKNGKVDNHEIGQVMLAIGKAPADLVDVKPADLPDYLRKVHAQATKGA